MKKPRLCLSLSVSLTLMQANLLAAYSAPANATIWQQLSGVNANQASSAQVKKPSVQGKAASNVHAAPSAAQGHAMLFLSGKGKAGETTGSAPAAALTIHPALPADFSSAINSASDKTREIASVEPAIASRATTEAAPEMAMSATGSSKQLLAQLAPDQLIAQADQGATLTATPIPPVVTGTVDLEEFKTTNVIDLKVAQSRTFKLKNKIVRTSISDPAIAEPVVVSENQIVLLGKTPGAATLVLWDDAGNSVAIDLRVTRDYGQLQSTLREIDPRIIVKAFSVGGSDRVLLLGDVDHVESVVRAFSSSNVFMDDRGMNVQVANNRLVNARIGEQGGTGGGGGGQAGQLAQLSSVDRYTFFPNTTNNLGKAQVITSDGGRVTSLVKVRKMPLIVLHVTFMEMNTTAARELGVQLGFNISGRGFGFGVGGNNSQGTSLAIPGALSTIPGSSYGNPSFVNPGAFFSANSVVVPTAGGGTVTDPISGIGLGVFNTVPTLLSQAVLLGAPGGASFSPGNLGNLFTGISQFSNKSFSEM